MNLKNERTGRIYFHCYATANENRLYLRDIKNFLRIKNSPSGFAKIVLLVAISEVRKINLFDRFFVKMVKMLFRKHPTIKVMEVYFKTNIGRDFSSYRSLLFKVKKIAHSDDFILFQNRSGYGAFQENWYRKFVDQFEKYDSIALCGSTINFKDHPARSFSHNLPHIQTYCFLTKVLHMNLLGNFFPGANETERLKIICNGEIGLSQFFLERNYKITCIEWPNEEISNESEPIVFSDIKACVTAKHSFYHRNYFKKDGIRIIHQLKYAIDTWFIFLSQGIKT